MTTTRLSPIDDYTAYQNDCHLQERIDRIETTVKQLYSIIQDILVDYKKMQIEAAKNALGEEECSEEEKNTSTGKNTRKG